jgi:hypothetical protein
MKHYIFRLSSDVLVDCWGGIINGERVHVLS